MLQVETFGKAGQKGLLGCVNLAQRLPVDYLFWILVMLQVENFG